MWLALYSGSLMFWKVTVGSKRLPVDVSSARVEKPVMSISVLCVIRYIFVVKLINVIIINWICIVKRKITQLAYSLYYKVFIDFFKEKYGSIFIKIAVLRVVSIGKERYQKNA